MLRGIFDGSSHGGMLLALPPCSQSPQSCGMRLQAASPTGMGLEHRRPIAPWIPPWFSAQHGSNLEQTLNLVQDFPTYRIPPLFYIKISFFKKKKKSTGLQAAAVFIWTYWHGLSRNHSGKRIQTATPQSSTCGFNCVTMYANRGGRLMFCKLIRRHYLTHRIIGSPRERIYSQPTVNLFITN